MVLIINGNERKLLIMFCLYIKKMYRLLYLCKNDYICNNKKYMLCLKEK